MFKRRCQLVVMVLLMNTLSIGISYSQVERISTQELKEMADKAFGESDYTNAYESYRTLLERYPRDAQFNYYAGLCLYYLNEDLPRAINYLEYAASKPEVPGDALFFLGKACQKNYQFSEAKTAFLNFERKADKNTSRELKPGTEAGYSGSAMELTLEYNPFEVKAMSLFSLIDTTYIKQVRGKGGTLSVKPPELLAKNEIPNEMTELVFLPKVFQRGDYIYYSGFSRSRKKGADLFRIKKTGQAWGSPEELGTLNSGEDDILPYYDPVGNDLYFASRGHSSMGGFDVFKSHYDAERDDWSEPVNLGFPINTPDNDYIAMPGPDLGSFMIISDRQGWDSLIAVYSIILKEPKKSLANATPEELKMIGNLGGIAPVPPISKKDESAGKSSITGVVTRVDDTNAESGQVISNQSASNDITKGLNYQRKSDSLAILAKEARLQAGKINDPNERWALQKQIIEWEKESKDLLDKANESFVRENEKEIASADPSVPGAIEKDREVNGTTVFRYKEQDKKENQSESSIQDAGRSEVDVKGLAREAFKSEMEPVESPVSDPKPIPSDLNRLMVLEKSPYSAQNPFPTDIELPGGPFYRIQLGVYSQDVEYSLFGGLFPITAETFPGKALTRFYAGKFNNYEDARKATETVRKHGFEDAFIVSWYNGEKTALTKVIELEKRDRSQSVK